MFRKWLLILSLLFAIGINISYACVGKTIYIGHINSLENELVGNILSRLITERTGTSVKLKKFSNANELFQAAVNGEIDLFMFDSNEIKAIVQTTDFEKAKTDINTKFNLVLLKPVYETKAGYNVPIIRKDTLKKFPALPRLIEKLNGTLAPNIVSELTKEIDKKGIKDTVREFLKSKNLI
jgi:osmoprotectant transport system substrate-binding protein